jgi:hypothetical protein
LIFHIAIGATNIGRPDLTYADKRGEKLLRSVAVSVSGRYRGGIGFLSGIDAFDIGVNFLTASDQGRPNEDERQND